MKKLLILILLLTGCQKEKDIDTLLNEMNELKNYEVKTEITGTYNKTYTTTVNNEKDELIINEDNNFYYYSDGIYYTEVEGSWINPLLGTKKLDFSILNEFQYTYENNIYKTEITDNYPLYYKEQTNFSSLDKMIIEISYKKYITNIKVTMTKDDEVIILNDSYSSYDSNDNYKMPIEIIFGEAGVVEKAELQAFETEMRMITSSITNTCLSNEISVLIGKGDNELENICKSGQMTTEILKKYIAIGTISISDNILIENNQIKKGIFYKDDYVISVIENQVMKPVKVN